MNHTLFTGGGDVETALGHLDYAVQLAELDEKKG